MERWMYGKMDGWLDNCWKEEGKTYRWKDGQEERRKGRQIAMWTDR